MVATAILAGSALASAGAGIGGMFANQGTAQRQMQLQEEQLQQDKQNAANQALVQALVNNRAVSGTTDSFGNKLQYDPATNTWRTTLGPLPEAAQRGAYSASVQQNTVDRARQELANQVAMERAARAGPAADAAARDVATFRPMQGSELTGLLTNQATIANRQAYDPLRADILRSTARTGTAAGPVLAELGRSEAQNLRQSLIDAQVQGMTGVGNINQQRLGTLTGKAGATAAEATPNAPQLATTPISDPGVANLQSQLTAAMARGAGGTTAQGAAGANTAQNIANLGASAAAGAVPNSNFELDKATQALTQLGQASQPGGSVSNLSDMIKGWMSGSGGQGTMDLSGSTPQNSAEADYIRRYYAGLGGSGGFGGTASSGTSTTGVF